MGANLPLSPCKRGFGGRRVRKVKPVQDALLVIPPLRLSEALDHCYYCYITIPSMTRLVASFHLSHLPT